jgi:uncharacterized LabA/DUF88 family protein
MALPQDHISMALFCDFENVALGVRDANYDKFDIKKVLERLLLKGSIVVKKAYCDWERYKGFKAAMHEANFELIEIPHVRQSGKNSADIRLVVDALDLCYTKSHVNTFVIISGDSDFSPLVSKLRENAKFVIGVGVKQSTSDLLIANCDEFIFYDDLVRDSQRQRRDSRDQPQQRRSPEEEKRRRDEMDARRTKAIEAAVETYEALVTDRDEGGRIWASVLKEAIKRRNPGFNENYYGYRTFGNLLEDARQRGLLDVGRDNNNSSFVSRGSGVPMRGEQSQAGNEVQPRHDAYGEAESFPAQDVQEAQAGKPRRERGRRGGNRHGSDARADSGAHDSAHDAGQDAALDADHDASHQRAYEPAEETARRHPFRPEAQPTFERDFHTDTDADGSAFEPPAREAGPAQDEATSAAKPAARGRNRQRAEGTASAEARPASKRARGRGTAKASSASEGDMAPAATVAAEPAQAAPAKAKQMPADDASGTPADTEQAGAKSASRNRRPRRPAAKKAGKATSGDQG